MHDTTSAAGAEETLGRGHREKRTAIKLVRSEDDKRKLRDNWLRRQS